mmetsp:Transcript_34696/g.95649  ORF Transcript_34696/g.95649 Transcript_34696/m.95649 type:complete len:244 (+) Transcript_34696:1236-1967(+)
MPMDCPRWRACSRGAVQSQSRELPRSHQGGMTSDVVNTRGHPAPRGMVSLGPRIYSNPCTALGRVRRVRRGAPRHQRMASSRVCRACRTGSPTFHHHGTFLARQAAPRPSGPPWREPPPNPTALRTRGRRRRGPWPALAAAATVFATPNPRLQPLRASLVLRQALSATPGSHQPTAPLVRRRSVEASPNLPPRPTSDCGGATRLRGGRRSSAARQCRAPPVGTGLSHQRLRSRPRSRWRSPSA